MSDALLVATNPISQNHRCMLNNSVCDGYCRSNNKFGYPRAEQHAITRHSAISGRVCSSESYLSAKLNKENLKEVGRLDLMHGPGRRHQCKQLAKSTNFAATRIERPMAGEPEAVKLTFIPQGCCCGRLQEGFKEDDDTQKASS